MEINELAIRGFLDADRNLLRRVADRQSFAVDRKSTIDGFLSRCEKKLPISDSLFEKFVTVMAHIDIVNLHRGFVKLERNNKDFLGGLIAFMNKNPDSKMVEVVSHSIKSISNGSIAPKVFSSQRAVMLKNELKKLLQPRAGKDS